MGYKPKQKLETNNKKQIIRISLVLVCVSVGIIIFVNHAVKPRTLSSNEKLRITEKLSEAIDKGNYKQAAKTRESVYFRLSNSEERAILARLIAADYYNAGDFKAGDKWINIAADYYSDKNQPEVMNSLAKQKAASRRQSSLNKENTTSSDIGNTP